MQSIMQKRNMMVLPKLMLAARCAISPSDSSDTANAIGNVPESVVALAAPDTHFVMLAQAILYRGAGIGIVWPQFLALAAIGAILFAIALARFRRTIGAMV
ncbi:hypothetical protein RYZ18_02350 [Roseovarius sp. 10]|uniref:hypothetical protein n=1 Tax=Roseovarius sp. 10 TaxID=3080563 RepID=UPI0029554385|nr:hypothetical protein [Roseovarius sp. 10]MDV7200162.1 hypothetical protein [Roseovarius sp. 10]